MNQLRIDSSPNKIKRLVSFDKSDDFSTQWLSEILLLESPSVDVKICMYISFALPAHHTHYLIVDSVKSLSERRPFFIWPTTYQFFAHHSDFSLTASILYWILVSTICCSLCANFFAFYHWFFTCLLREHFHCK